MKTIGRVLLLLFIPALLLLPACGARQWSDPPPMSIDQSKEYGATIETNYGNIEVQLFPKEAPLAVNNFIFLSHQNFYNGIKFHRIVKGSFIQTGDPTATGYGGPGYEFKDEEVTRDYVTGTLAMANSGPNTNGSQFFITLTNLTSLPKKYTIFGIVTDGFNVINKIANVSVSQSPDGEWSLPDANVYIKRITITEK